MTDFRNGISPEQFTIATGLEVAPQESDLSSEDRRGLIMQRLDMEAALRFGPPYPSFQAKLDEFRDDPYADLDGELLYERDAWADQVPGSFNRYVLEPARQFINDLNPFCLWNVRSEMSISGTSRETIKQYLAKERLQRSQRRATFFAKFGFVKGNNIDEATFNSEHDA